MTFMIRVNDDPISHVAAARAAVAAEDADLAVYGVQSMDQLIQEDLQGSAVLTSLTTTFAMLALALAAVGIYGMLAYVVAQRTREMAIRIALGAQAPDVVRHVLKGGLGAVAIGLVLGLAVSLPLASVLRGVLYGVSANDPATYALVALVLLGSALMACLVPARRALRLDPVVALRAD
jgi:ABC-type antimicrobial peptide transport system permease subunit